ncbi:unnamed protein product [Callosobruchus maculatus]|uniref:Uncharacterized protein n=1 Tax=Callosobruchus maculatus TaxID=64391 RepID=A0A653DFN8_CALMS|nr:unnamed protein product [Callosobruchus maculatus]
MDPATKYYFREALRKIRDSGKCIILTSHSLEECESVCTRLAIMVRGRFMCLGSVQHLKSKFAKGCTFTIKIKRDAGIMNNITKMLRLSTARSILLSVNRSFHVDVIPKVNVVPLLVQAQQEKNPWIWQQNDKIKAPVIQQINRIELPNGLTWVPPEMSNPTQERIIEAPTVPSNNVTKHAARLILRQKRELKKEKAFQAVLVQQIKDAEQFSAEKYVQEKIEKLNEIVVPRFWNGRRLPEFLIREKMGLPPKK